MSKRIARRSVIAGAAATAAVTSFPALVRGQEVVKVSTGIANTISDAPCFIAEEKGFWKDQGLDVSLIAFDSGAKMNGVLGTGQLDCAAAGPSAGLYNGLQRGINIKIVADKGSTPPGYGFSPILVRKSLIESGRVKTLHDVKGMTWAEPAQASVSSCTSTAAWEKAGLVHQDLNEVFMGFPDHVVAYQNGSIDAGNTAEPAATRAVEIGAAVRFWSNDQFYPNQQIATVLYSTSFAQKAEIAQRWMIGYLKAVRLYNDALKDGHYAGPAADDVIAILAKRTAVKDPAVYKRLTPNGCNPNGRLNVASLKRDLQIFKDAGYVKGPVDVEQALDTSSVEAALKVLGPYKPRRA
jgi:NitT/TauT family transport system substrate-binding protein